MIHDLKCWPEYFQAVIDGRKPFELRKNDRKFTTKDEFKRAGMKIPGPMNSWSRAKDPHDGLAASMKPKARRIARRRLKREEKRAAE